MCRRLPPILLPLLLLCAPGPALAATEPHPRVTLGWIETPPEIDGVLDEGEWDGAGIVDDFTQAEPDEGAPASQRTLVYFATDGGTLFIGVRCFDSDPDEIVVRRMLRDDDMFFEDRFNISIDTFHDHRNGYFFQINPAGGRRDALIEGPTFQDDWDTIWAGEATIDAQGWSAEIAIPFQSVNFDPQGVVWGLNMSRGIRRNSEDARWADPYPGRSMINMATAGVLENVRGIHQGLGLDVIPGSTLRYVNDPVENREYTKWDPSVDVFYKILPSLTGAFTANTDFGETEVDARQVNLTRFALFFPEKRDFFLQDALIFDFANLSSNDPTIEQNGRPFFSRKIGLGPDGEPIDVRAGVKLTGRVGRFNIGLLDTQLEGYSDESLSPPNHIEAKNLAVGRVSMNVLGESKVGVIVTNGDPFSNRNNTLVGTDFNYRDSDFAGWGRTVTGNAWFQQSISSGTKGSDEQAYGLALAYPNDRYRWDLLYKELRTHFNPALGFSNRTNIRQYQGSFRLRQRPGNLLRTVDESVNARLITTLDNRVDTGELIVTPVEIFTGIVDGFNLAYVHRFERLSAPFDLAGKVMIPPGSYHFDEGRLHITTSNNRPVRGDFDLSYGTFFSGRRLRVRPLIEWRPSIHWLFAVEYDHNEFWFPVGQGGLTGNGRSRTRVLRLRMNVQFTPNIAWLSFVQYDNVSDSAGVNTRLRWIVSDGREFFIVFNQGIVAVDGELSRGKTEPLIKAVWTLRF